ncbi:hypothetical protein [Bradyrhizobium sp. JYMT SZCCT0428]|uniref:hypothetical protein n=1 Tax=Bradyrhizobium sp. JYMT SZCCT0428 TaxID=2807673 RepID=UPI001BADC714|nr:hypothetical protein [Bradyrhizobium sp. JYMT SZCCT0428]MBR1149480.1 hypothetical protein [Bradyrhizobium sp. JYMT SZCCT0428]
MLTKLLAIVVFHNSNDLNRGSAELIKHGFFDAQYHNDRSMVCVNAWTLSDLDDESFFFWVQDIVEPVGGHVFVAGLWHDADALPGLPTNGSPQAITINRLP